MANQHSHGYGEITLEQATPSTQGEFDSVYSLSDLQAPHYYTALPNFPSLYSC